MTKTAFASGDDEVRKAVDLLRSKGYWVLSPGPLGEPVPCMPLTETRSATKSVTLHANDNWPLWNGGVL